MQIALLLLTVLAVVVLAGLALRWSDRRKDAIVWAGLRARQARNPARFDPAVLDGLPEPVQRYFRFAIAPGTRLFPLAEIDMQGDFGPGSRDAPNYAPMVARQILCAPHGFVWQMSSGLISGSDGLGPDGSWTRFRLAGLVPVARAGFSDDHRRSAFARAVAEAAIWAPASVLPGPGITWQAIGPDTARLTFASAGAIQSVDLTLAANGAPVAMVMPRWSNANPQKIWQIQPFGATLGGFRDFHGFRLPTRVEAGNFFGTEDWFAFFRATLTDIRFPT